jgi:hypothetical protein
VGCVGVAARLLRCRNFEVHNANFTATQEPVAAVYRYDRDVMADLKIVNGSANFTQRGVRKYYLLYFFKYSYYGKES